MNVDNADDDANVTADFPDVSLENAMNNEITIDEIKRAKSKLNNVKSAGVDNVTNEYIKGSCSEHYHCIIRCLILFWTRVFSYFLVNWLHYNIV